MSTSEDRLRVAVVGAGAGPSVAHIPGWQRDPRVEVVALADTDAEVAGAVAAKFGVPRAVTDYRELLDDPGVDVDRRGHRQPAALPDLLGRPVRGQARAVREAGAHRLPQDPARPPSWPRRRGLQDQARLHVPVRAGDPVRQGPDRLRLRRRAVHLQRLRAEQPVDRPGDPAAPGRPGGRPGADRGVLHRGLRRADHRHHALVARRAADRGGRHHAQLRPAAGSSATPAG